MEHLVSKNTGHPERISHLSQETDLQALEKAAKRLCHDLSQRIGDIIFGFEIQHETHRTGEYTINFYLDKTASEEDINIAKEITADIKLNKTASEEDINIEKKITAGIKNPVLHKIAS